jgi:hypothetical protein
MTSDFGKQIYKAIKEGVEQVFREPDEPPSKASQAQLRKYEILFKRYLDNDEKYTREKTKVFRVIMFQCTPTMRNKVESLPDYPDLEEKDDYVGLLKRIKELVYSTDNTQYEFWRIQASFVKLATMKQDPKETVNNYAKRFLAQVEATESMWGPLVPSMAIRKEEIHFDEEDDDATRKKVLEEQAQLEAEDRYKARSKFLACLFLAGSDRERYKSVVDDLGNDYTLGKANYPNDVAGMLNLLTNRRGIGGNKSRQAEDLQDGVMTSFQQASHPKLKCNYCGKPGHASEVCYKRQCYEAKGDDKNSGKGWFDEKTRSGVTGFQYMEKSAWDPEA